jgi:hypothetical protein
VNVWHDSLLYRLWVIGGLVGIVAFTVIGGLSDPSNQDFILYLIPVIAVWVAGIFFLQWRAVNRDARANPVTAEPSTSLVRWNIGFGAILCVCIFAGVFAYYAGLRETLYPLGESGPGLPLVLIPAVALVFIGAARTLRVVRDLGRGNG